MSRNLIHLAASRRPKAAGYLIAALMTLAVLVAVSARGAEQANGAETKPVGPVFKEGEAQVVEAFSDPDRWLRHDLWVETEFDSDGDGKLDRMHVGVTRPWQTESDGLRLPVVYISSPYFSGVGSTDEAYFWDVRHELGAEPPPRTAMPEVELKVERPIISKSHLKTWLPRGYVVVHSSAPGTGLSAGCPTLGGDNEPLAPKAVIDWLCGRGKGFTTPDGDEPVTAYWSSGAVGMTGTSYNGTIALAAATTGVEGLRAIIPIAPNTSYYHYYRSNGLVRHPGGYLGEDIDYLYDFIHSGNAARREFCDCEVRDKTLIPGMDRITGDYNDFWAQRDYLHHLAPLKAAVLMAHGFNDWNVTPEHSNRIYQALKAQGVPTQTYYHQEGHGGPPPLRMMNRWFTRYLHGIENGVEDDPRAWIVREDAKRDEPTAYDDFPNPLATAVDLYLGAGAPERGELLTAAITDQGHETLVDNFSFSGETLARAEWTEHRLLYVTETLQTPLHLSGTATVRIRLASSKPAANLSVWLVSLPWNEGEKVKITENLITRGWADPQNHRSQRGGEPLQPGRFYDVHFELQPDDQIIAAGQQIGLMIFSSDRDVTLWPNPGTELTIDLDATRLSLPVVGGAEAFEQAFEQAVAP
ncbi:MAG: Xaa-Pro dipeptidyl-peptidase [Novipirellula sp. JB048]